MEEQKENPCTTLWVYKTTRDRFRSLKGRGVTADRFLNILMDMVPEIEGLADVAGTYTKDPGKDV